MKRNLKAIVIVSFLIALCFAVAMWFAYIKPRLLISRTRYGHMLELSWAIMDFNTKEGRLPASLDEVVSKGYLPRKSKIYYSPMLHGSLWEKDISYMGSEYDFVFKPDFVTISVPGRAFVNGAFLILPEEQRKLEISKDLTAESGK